MKLQDTLSSSISKDSLDKTFSSARKTHYSVLPNHAKFQGSTEYKSQYTDKGVVFESPYSSLDSETIEDSSRSSRTPGLSTKKLKEQNLTEHKSHYIWPGKDLLNQHHQRPRKSPNYDSKLTNEGLEEMKSIDNSQVRQTSSSWMETDSIGARVSDFSNTPKSTNTSIQEEKPR
jgi:hypothetical protein